MTSLSDEAFFIEFSDSGEAFVVVERLLGDLTNGLVGVERHVGRDDDVMHRSQFLKNFELQLCHPFLQCLIPVFDTVESVKFIIIQI